MKAKAPILVIAAALVLAACTSGSGPKKVADTTSPSSTAESTTTEPTTAESALTAAELEDRLLDIDDLPAGWEATDNMSSEGDGEDDAFCPGADRAFEPFDENEAGEVTFEQEEIRSVVAQLGATVTADQYDTAIAALDVCIGQEWTDTDDDGTETSFVMEAGSAPTLGNDSTSYRITGTLTGGQFTMDAVFGRVDGGASMLMVVTVQIAGQATETMSQAEFDELVETASTKLLADDA